MAEVVSSCPTPVDVYLPSYENTEGEEAPSYEGTRGETADIVENELDAEEEVIRIGNKFALSLVTEGQLVNHLVFLGALYRLKLDVIDASSTHYAEFPGITGSNAREKAWQVFVRRAVHRFEVWFRKIANTSTPSLSREEYIRYTTSLIPLGIAMVWHSYVLNPLEYYEDEVRGLNTMKTRAFPLAELSRHVDKDTLRVRAVESQEQDIFHMATGISYDPPFGTSSSEVLHVQCPVCEDAVWNVVYWLDPGGTGYAQTSFAATCRICDTEFTREAMGIRKLTNDIYLWKKQRDRYCLAGTRLNAHSGAPWREASKLTHILTAPMLSSTAFKNIDMTPSSMAKALRFRFSEVEYYFRQSVMGLEGLRTDVRIPPRIQEILACYTDSSPFSVDLVDAIITQQDFIEGIEGLVHSKSLRDVLPEIAATAISRYSAYWELLTEEPKKCQIPSIDIDLCLHTHQLYWSRYRHQSLDLIGRIPDHERLSDPAEFSEALRVTAEAWKALEWYSLTTLSNYLPQGRYGVAYTQVDVESPTTAHRIFFRVLHSRKISQSKVKVKEGLLYPSAEFHPLTAPSTHFRGRINLTRMTSLTRGIQSRYKEARMPLRPLQPLDISELYSPKGDTFTAYWGIGRNIFDGNNPWERPVSFSWSEKKRERQTRKIQASSTS